MFKTFKRFNRFMPLFAFIALPVCAAAQIPGPDAPSGFGSPLRYDAPAGPLTGGYNSHADAADFDGDGDLDLVVHSALGGGANNTFWGVHIYESHSRQLFNAPPAFIAAPRKVLAVDKHALACDWDQDGSPDLIAGEKWHRNMGNFRFAEGESIPHFPANVKLILDWNNDGLPDLLTGEKLSDDFWPAASVWRSGESPYTDEGIWKGGPLRGSLRLHRGVQVQDGLSWEDGGVLQAGGVNLEVYGEAHPAAADWDGDGDLDLLVGGHFNLIYFENIGDSKNPRLAYRRPVYVGGQTAMRGIYIRPVVYPQNHPDSPDVIIAQESGQIGRLVFAGFDDDQTPRFKREETVIQLNALLDAGCLSTISAGDWDDDGDPDIVSGNSYGEVILFRNQQDGGGSNPRARFTHPEPLRAGDAPIRITAGPNGSIQGPNEARYGYTCPVLCDWNRDGLMDLILSDIWGRHVYYQRAASTESNQDRLLPGAPVLCKSPDKDAFVPPWVWHKPRSHELITQWRCQPAVVDWNRDGVLDLITLDSRGRLALYPGVQASPQPEVGPPQRCFLQENGAPIRITNGLNGRSGRARIVIADWDGDGDRDILRGCTHAGDHEDPDFADYERVTVWYENAGDDQTFHFRGSVMRNDDDVSFCGHAVSPAVIDWDGNGSLDLLLGAEDGLIYYFTREYLEGKTMP